jgi:hypothetical protein
MASKVSVEIKGKEDVSQAAQKAKGGLDGLASGANSLVQKFGGLALAGAGVVAAIKVIAKAADECVQAFAENEKATLSFNAAIQTTPGLSTTAGETLREYAGQIASMTGETQSAVLAMEAMLLKSGRTEQQIQDMLKVAVDFSAATGKDMRSALEQLNKTFGGTAGELAELIPSLKELTKEELANGDAVKLIAEQYKGMGDALAESASVGINNYKNAINELKAAIGDSINSAIKPFRDALTETIIKLTESINKTRELARAKQALASGEATREQKVLAVMDELTDLQSQLEVMASPLDGFDMAGSEMLKRERADIEKRINILTKVLKDLQSTTGPAIGSAAWLAGMGVTPPATTAPTTSTSTSAASQAVEEAMDVLVQSIDRGTKLLRGQMDANGQWINNAQGLQNAGPGPASGNTGGQQSGPANNLVNNLIPPESLGVLDQFGASILGLVSSFEIMDPVAMAIKYILEGIMEVLGPLMDDLLEPVIGMLRIFGQLLGKLLAPALKILFPIIKAIADAFVFIYNKVIVPIYNAWMTTMNLIYNGFAAFVNGILWLVDQIPFVDVGRVKYKSLDEGHLEEITTGDVYSAGAKTGTNGQTGSSASYSQVRDITVNVEINTSALVGEGGVRDFAIMIGRELKSAGVLGAA